MFGLMYVVFKSRADKKIPRCFGDVLIWIILNLASVENTIHDTSRGLVQGS